LRLVLTLITGNLDPNSMVALLLAAIAAFLLLTGLRRRQRDRSARSALPSPRLAKEPLNPDGKEKLRRDLENLIGELQDLSRKISAEMDTRFAKLEAAIRDADRRIAVLNRLSREMDEKTGRTPSEPEDHDARYAVIYELADAGFSCVDIAKDLGKTPGEIELILNLRRTAQK
jgi:hypothetical protein